MKSHLDSHAVPTAWRLVHGSWGISTGVGLRDRAGQDSGWSGPWRHVSPFGGGGGTYFDRTGHRACSWRIGGGRGTPEITQAIKAGIADSGGGGGGL